MHRRAASSSFLCALLLVPACKSGEAAKPAECEGAPIVPFKGDHALVVSSLVIGEAKDGFDLDHDGDPDNKMAAIGPLAGPSIRKSFDDFELILPMEVFDFPMAAVDECMKFAIYVGHYQLDVDTDGADTARAKGDCNDHDEAIHPGAVEVPDDGKDNDCDGLADEIEVTSDADAGATTSVEPSTNTDDADGDGVTIADGDCDDHEATVKGPTVPEICGDGLDNDCDGAADYGRDDTGKPDCTPYDDTPDRLVIDPLSFDPMTMRPSIEFPSASVTQVGDALHLVAGPSVFVVNIPIQDDSTLELRISGTTIEGDVVSGPTGLGLVHGRLGGVLDARTLDQVRGLEVSDIGLRREDSLADAMFANVLGTLIGLKHNSMGCQMPDIDVDGDGLEAFCDTSPDDDKNVVDTCIDGDGRMYRDTPTTSCTEEKNEDGTYKFVDGVSVEMNLEAVPALSLQAP